MKCDGSISCFLTIIASAVSLVSFCTSMCADEPEIKLTLPEGFVGERIYDVPNRQGSWVSMTNDPKGRLIVSDQYGTLYRVDTSSAEIAVEQIPLKIGFAQGLLCAFDSLYVVSHEGKFDQVGKDGKKTKQVRPPGLYRLTDTDDDDQYDKVQLLREFDGGSEHGPHAVILSPDKQSLYICAGNHTMLPAPEKSLVPRVWQEDQLTPRLPDAGGHAVGRMAPGGWICKTDPEGKEFELISAGYRNQYDIAFNELGDLFTFDADMEWDIGLPWYRPTRVCHVTSGSEFGWRNGSGKWPTYFPDNLPAVIDVGPGSPTGITFGTGARFPQDYQKALYIADWSFGIIHKIDLQPSGSSYTATKSTFCRAPVLPVTDMVINPSDGAMYFLIGGRRTQSALYRVSYAGDQSVEKYVATKDDQPELGWMLKEFDEGLTTDTFDDAWNMLNHNERQVRFTARAAIERYESKNWYPRALDAEDVQTKLESLLALIRTCEDKSMHLKVVQSLEQIDFKSLSEMQQLHLLRNIALVVIRMGPLSDDSLESIQGMTRFYPSKSILVDRELARLLCAVEADDVVEKTLQLLSESDSQQQQIHYAMVLHRVKNGWTTENRTRFLNWFADSVKYAGGSSFRKYLANIRNKFVGEMPEQEREKLKTLWQEPIDEPLVPYADLKQRPVVSNWTLADLQDLSVESANIKNGKKLFALTQCYNCHIIGGEGGIVGPDLTNAGRRFSIHDLLETIIDPDKEISDQYRATVFQLDDGRVVTGRIANLTRNKYMIQEDMINPGKFTRFDASQIEEMKPSEKSMMPAGLLDTLNRQEIIDLIGYMKSTAQER